MDSTSIIFNAVSGKLEPSYWFIY